MHLPPPASWYDVEQFLQQGGYLEVFRARHQVRGSRRRKLPWLPQVTGMMRSNAEHMSWLDEWIGVTFQGCRHDGVLQSESYRMFFETAWHIFCGNPQEALKMVNDFRRAYNFGTLLDLPPTRTKNIIFDDSRKRLEEGTGRYPEPYGLSVGGDQAEVMATTADQMRDFCTLIPSGLHIPGFEKEDSPLSVLSDEEPPMLDSFGGTPTLPIAGNSSSVTSPLDRAEEDEKDALAEPVKRRCGRPRKNADPKKGSHERAHQKRATPLRSSLRPAPQKEVPMRRKSVEIHRKGKNWLMSPTQGLASEAPRLQNPSDLKVRPRTAPPQMVITKELERSKHQKLQRQERLERRSSQGSSMVDIRKRSRVTHLFSDADFDLGSNASALVEEPPRKRHRTSTSSPAVTIAVTMSSEPILPMMPGPSPEGSQYDNTPHSPVQTLASAIEPLGDLTPMSPQVDHPTNPSSKPVSWASDSTMVAQEAVSSPVDTSEMSRLLESMRSDDTPVLSSPMQLPLDKINPDDALVSPPLRHGPSNTIDADVTLVSPSSTHIPLDRMESNDTLMLPSASPVPLDMMNSDDTLILSSTAPASSGLEHSPILVEPGDIYEPFGPLPPASKHPSLPLGPHLHMPILQASEFGLEDGPDEPPWRSQHDSLILANNARPPGAGDTHHWSLPQASAPTLLDFPPQPLQPPLGYNLKVHKPEIKAEPPVWAQSRQELCESLSYFRSYQGGVYSQKKRARGYLLDGYPAMQDLWHAEGRNIISHGGGNSATDKQTGQTVLVDDQTSRSISCSALLNSWKSQQPIVLLAGDGYSLFPYDLGDRRYVVLGYYLIAHAWEEPEPSLASSRGYFVRWKFLFQWIASQGTPWWLNDPTRKETRPTEQAPRFSRVCQHCFEPSPIIYKFGWVCTHSDCSLFFRRDDTAVSPEAGYHLDFLTLKEEPLGCRGLTLEIRPRLPVERKSKSDGIETDQISTSRHFWKGWCCPKCGRLSCREYWTHWECQSCHLKHQIKSSIQSPLTGQYAVGKTFIHASKTAGIVNKVRLIHVGTDVFRCQSFHLPWNRGVVHLIQANGSIQGAADYIWRQYQVDAQEPGFFRRYSMKTHKLKGRMLSHYFSQNSGESYAYVGGTDNTVPLERYSSVRQAIALIRQQASLVLGKDPAFNEILSAAYMAEQKMEFHSDGEKDLGPVVASLSLGSPATMRFRPVPSKWSAPESADATLQRKSPPIVLTLTLRHGDALVMEGAEIQEYYQHAVHPWGFRIAATARYIHAKG